MRGRKIWGQTPFKIARGDAVERGEVWQSEWEPSKARQGGGNGAARNVGLGNEGSDPFCRRGFMMVMDFDGSYLPYAGARYPIYAQHGMVAASSPQASAAGLEMLRRGGNAVDAAVAAATTLTVVEPTANGIGSDAFALVWIEKERRLYGLNASGWAPRDISIEKVIAALGKAIGESKRTGGARGVEDEKGAEAVGTAGASATARAGGVLKMPTYGWVPTMVPGAPKAWASLMARFGRLGLSTAMAPAIDYAENGYPASPNLARMWQRAFEKYKATLSGPEFAEWFHTFAPEGHAPAAGDIIRLPDHARTLKAIAESDSDDFYHGELAERIVADSREFGGFFCKDDFAEYAVQWVEPISVNYRGYDICEIPPNGQGIVALMALNILKEFEFTTRESPETFHLQWEAMKIAFADGLAHITDPAAMRVAAADLIQPEYGALRAHEIEPGGPARLYTAKTPPKSGTVYLCTADSEGNMVSYIQSNYMGFGSGIVVRGTGISLQNRGADFSLDARHPNCLAPRKKTYHTIIPGFILKDGRAIGPFGVMGGYMQPQGHVQTVTNLVDFHLNPQQALDAPRWQWILGRKFMVERAFSAEIIEALARRGHEIEVSADSTPFGRGQIIVRLPNGTLVGGTEGRTDSNIACW